MFVIEKKKIFFGISGALVALSLFFIFVWGLNFGIDFVGGSLVEVSYVNGDRPDASIVEKNLLERGFGNAVVQSAGDDGFIIRTRTLEGNEHRELVALLGEGGRALEEKRFTSIGPVIGDELRQKAVIAIGLTVLLIIIFVAFSFRHVSKPVSSWKYGVVAIVALIHDILIPTGLFAFLGRFINAEVDTLFVTALLAILGLSVNDTIVVFDRIRENLLHRVSKRFDETVGISLKQTITRSINTSVTTLFVLGTLFFIGPESTRNFALVLSVGLIAGTYSSIFLASPLLVQLAGKRNK